MKKTKKIKPISILLIGFLMVVKFSTSIANDFVNLPSDNRSVELDTFYSSGNNYDEHTIYRSGFEAISNIPLISSFTATPNVLDDADFITLSWTTNNNATHCIRSGDWIGLTNHPDGTYNEALIVTSTSTFSLQCFNSFGSSQLKSVQVIVSEQDSPPLLMMSASASLINPGESSIIRWTLANNTEVCIKTGDWSGTLAGNDVTNGHHELQINDIIADSSFSLNCFNSFGNSGTQTVLVSIIEGPVDCSIQQPPILNGSEDRTIRLIPGATGNQLGTPGNPAPYNGFYDEILRFGMGWPGGTGGQSFASLSKDQYIAMEFTTNFDNEIGRLTFVPPGNAQGPVSFGTTVAISECPGDFTTHLNQDRCKTIGGGSPNLRWSQNPNTSGNTHCLLEKGTRYYLNIVHSNSEETGFSESACDFPFCGIIFGND